MITRWIVQYKEIKKLQSKTIVSNQTIAHEIYQSRLRNKEREGGWIRVSRRVKLIPMWHQWPETNRQSGDFMLWPRYRDGNRPVTRGNPLAASFGALIHKRGDIPAARWSNERKERERGGGGGRERERSEKRSEGKPGERVREGREREKRKKEKREKERERSLSPHNPTCVSPRVSMATLRYSNGLGVCAGWRSPLSHARRGHLL